MQKKTLMESEQWAQETFGQAELGDPRRTRRLVRVASQMAQDPQGSLPQQMEGNRAALKAAYRLVRAEGVTHEAISTPVWQQTAQQMSQEREPVLLLHDDTALDYGYAPAIAGLGPIGNGSHQGLFVHTVLAVVAHQSRARMLGLAAQLPWVRQPAPRAANGRKQTSRQRRGRERESQLWERAVQRVGRPAAQQLWVHVGDRYADMFAFWQSCRQEGTHFVVRAAHNRRLLAAEGEGEGEANAALEHLLDRVRSWPGQAHGTLELASEHERRARQAQVQLSWGELAVPPTAVNGHVRRSGTPMRVWAVRVWEAEPPCQAEAQRAHIPLEKHGHQRRRPAQQSHPEEPVEAVEWILLCSLPVETEEQAWRMISWYRARWLIEEFHRGLKTGCGLQQRHLREERSLENLLAVLSPLAVRLLQVRNLASQHPDEPALAWVEAQEAQVIATQQQVPVMQLTIGQFVRRVAAMGGFLGRASDGQPGWQTLWRGWQHLHWFVAGMRFAASTSFT
jgi:Transposase DNA-binding/Transposase Tn5 dimerisation domain